jgi:hypothetical protein
MPEMPDQPVRNLTFPLNDLLDVVSAAEDYGYGDDVLMDALARWAGPVTDAEIAAFTAGFLTPESRAQGYTEEDRDGAIERLTEWRDRYARPEPEDEP